MITLLSTSPDADSRASPIEITGSMAFVVMELAPRANTDINIIIGGGTSGRIRQSAEADSSFGLEKYWRLSAQSPKSNRHQN
jgi:hypothetical protein